MDAVWSDLGIATLSEADSHASRYLCLRANLERHEL